MLVTDPAFGAERTIEVARAAGAALPRGAFAVVLRVAPPAPVDLDVAALGTALRRATREVGAILLVNAAPALVLAGALGADGVHLGAGARGVSVADARASLGERALLTVPAHDDDDVRHARAHRVDAVLVSPVFDPGKPHHAPPRGVAAIASARSLAGDDVAVFALGGVGATNARACFVAGADGVAVVRHLYEATDAGAAARALVC